LTTCAAGNPGTAATPVSISAMPMPAPVSDAAAPVSAPIIVRMSASVADFLSLLLFVPIHRPDQFEDDAPRPDDAAPVVGVAAMPQTAAAASTAAPPATIRRDQ
jgi:hypothetical protein